VVDILPEPIEEGAYQMLIAVAPPPPPPHSNFEELLRCRGMIGVNRKSLQHSQSINLDGEGGREGISLVGYWEWEMGGGSGEGR
jgi:hypothetical protein